MQRNVDNEMRNKILPIDPEKWKEFKINKSALWYQQRKIKTGEALKVYNKIRMRIK